MKKNNKTIKNIKIELLNLLKEQFYLRMQVKKKKLHHTHFLKKIRRKIAYFKMLLSNKKEKNETKNKDSKRSCN